LDPGERSRMTESHLPKRPVISVSLSPKFLDDWDKLQLALSVLTQRLISPATLWKRVSLQQRIFNEPAYRAGTYRDRLHDSISGTVQEV